MIRAYTIIGGEISGYSNNFKQSAVKVGNQTNNNDNKSELMQINSKLGNIKLRQSRRSVKVIWNFKGPKYLCDLQLTK